MKEQESLLARDDSGGESGCATKDRQAKNWKHSKFDTTKCRNDTRVKQQHILK